MALLFFLSLSWHLPSSSGTSEVLPHLRTVLGSASTGKTSKKFPGLFPKKKSLGIIFLTRPALVANVHAVRALCEVPPEVLWRAEILPLRVADVALEGAVVLFVTRYRRPYSHDLKSKQGETLFVNCCEESER